MITVKVKASNLRVGNEIVIDGLHWDIVAIKGDNDGKCFLELEDHFQSGETYSLTTFCHCVFDMVDTRKIIQISSVNAHLVALCDDNTLWIGLITSGNVDWRRLNNVPTGDKS